MDNNPIAFNDPDGDKIKGSRADKKAFKNYHKAEGTWKDIRKTYRGNRRDLIINSTSSTNESMATASIEPTPYGADGRDISKKTDWFKWNPGADNSSGDAAQDNTGQDNLLKVESRKPVLNNELPRQLQQINVVPILPIVPNPVDFRINAPFIGGLTTFSNPVNGQTQLQNVANTFLNSPGATQILITIGTNTINLDQPSTNPDGRSVRTLLRDRGRAMMQQLRAMGVPITAFPNNWLQFAPGTNIGTNIRVR